MSDVVQEPVTVALAILTREGRFLLQLRDNIPGIPYPGYWGLFGGHLESGETPEAALERELWEEINYVPTKVQKFCYSAVSDVIRYVYSAPLTVPIDKLVLQEGWDLDLLYPEDIRQGSCYSSKAGEIRPIGKPHQEILLDFITKNKC